MLRGGAARVQVNVWHPWFGAEASLFQSQVAQFNTENEWGIIVSAQVKGNYSELFLQTDAAIEEFILPADRDRLSRTCAWSGRIRSWT